MRIRGGAYEGVERCPGGFGLYSVPDLPEENVFLSSDDAAFARGLFLSKSNVVDERDDTTMDSHEHILVLERRRLLGKTSPLAASLEAAIRKGRVAEALRLLDRINAILRTF